MFCKLFLVSTLVAVTLAQNQHHLDTADKTFEYNVDIQENLADKLASLNVNAGAAYDNFANFTSDFGSVTSGPIYEIFATIGDVALPTLMLGLTVFAFYVAFQLVVQFLGLAFNTKFGILNSFLNFLGTSSNAVVQKFVSIASDTDVENAVLSIEERRRRAAGYSTESELLDLLSGVFRAVQKYE